VERPFQWDTDTMPEHSTVTRTNTSTESCATDIDDNMTISSPGECTENTMEWALCNECGFCLYFLSLDVDCKSPCLPVLRFVYNEYFFCDVVVERPFQWDTDTMPEHSTVTRTNTSTESCATDIDDNMTISSPGECTENTMEWALCNECGFCLYFLSLDVDCKSPCLPVLRFVYNEYFFCDVVVERPFQWDTDTMPEHSTVTRTNTSTESCATDIDDNMTISSPGECTENTMEWALCNECGFCLYFLSLDVDCKSPCLPVLRFVYNEYFFCDVVVERPFQWDTDTMPEHSTVTRTNTSTESCATDIDDNMTISSPGECTENTMEWALCNECGFCLYFLSLDVDCKSPCLPVLRFVYNEYFFCDVVVERPFQWDTDTMPEHSTVTRTNTSTESCATDIDDNMTISSPGECTENTMEWALCNECGFCLYFLSLDVDCKSPCLPVLRFVYNEYFFCDVVVERPFQWDTDCFCEESAYKSCRYPLLICECFVFQFKHNCVWFFFFYFFFFLDARQAQTYLKEFDLIKIIFSIEIISHLLPWN
jgi:selenophosphate synthetase-related protein